MTIERHAGRQHIACDGCPSSQPSTETAAASGFESKARGRAGCALFLVERASSGEIIAAWAGIAGRDGVRPDVFYRLVDGKPVEVP
jgi:hypothetical protein